MEYKRQVSVENEGEVTENLALEFSRTESRILGALSKLHELLLNPQVRIQSGTYRKNYLNTDGRSQGLNGDRSQIEPHPELGLSVYQLDHSNDPRLRVAPHTFIQNFKST